MNKAPQTTQNTRPAATSIIINNTTTQTNNPNRRNEEFVGTLNSLNSLLADGNSVKCAFSNNTNDINITGTLYAASGKLREDYQSTFKIREAGVMSGHLIADSREVYEWDDQMKDGSKFSIARIPSPTSGQHSQMPDFNDNIYHFSCQPWTVDSSLFTLPSNINFQ